MWDLSRVHGQPRIGRLNMTDVGQGIVEGKTYDNMPESTHYTSSPKNSPSKALYHWLFPASKKPALNWSMNKTGIHPDKYDNTFDWDDSPFKDVIDEYPVSRKHVRAKSHTDKKFNTGPHKIINHPLSHYHKHRHPAYDAHNNTIRKQIKMKNSFEESDPDVDYEPPSLHPHSMKKDPYAAGDSPVKSF